MENIADAIKKSLEKGDIDEIRQRLTFAFLERAADRKRKIEESLQASQRELAHHAEELSNGWANEGIQQENVSPLLGARFKVGYDNFKKDRVDELMRQFSGLEVVLAQDDEGEVYGWLPNVSVATHGCDSNDMEDVAHGIAWLGEYAPKFIPVPGSRLTDKIVLRRVVVLPPVAQ